MRGPTSGEPLDWSPLALGYRVEGDVTLAGDGLAHRLVIAMLEFKAGLKCMWQSSVERADLYRV